MSDSSNTNPPSLCEVCCGVSPYTTSSIRTTSKGQELGYHHKLFEDFKDSSRTCPLCKLVLEQLTKSSHPIRLKKGKQHQLLLCSDKYHTRQDTPRQVSGVSVRITNSNARAFLHTWAYESSAAALSGDVAGRPLHPAPNSPGAFRQIQTWINDCITNHPECNSVPLASSDPPCTTRFPSRLLDVGADPQNPFVRLTDRQNALGPYVALSYCWGPAATQLRSLKSNLSSHTNVGIKISTMPATLRDAVIATRTLGLRYLWIDALCIIQDEESDWMREAPQMGLIYQNAHLTLAATGSSTSTGGLFHPRDDLPGDAIELSYQVPGREPRRTFFIAPQPPSFEKYVTASTWNTRGWVLQERNLSRRIVLFSAGQLFFECIRQSIAEDGYVLVGHQDTRLGSASLRRGPGWAWCSIVQNYTACNLTYGEDKLFAIEGMAANVRARDSTDIVGFCAGVAVGSSGSDILAMNLLWRADGNKPMQEARLRETTAWRQRAPSWSWASLEGPVVWELFVPEAEVSCRVEVVGGIPSGVTPHDQQVREAKLRFTGLAVEVVRSTAERLGDVGCDIHAYLIDFEDHAACYALLDDAGNAILGWGVFDQSDKIEGPFIAVVVSRNVDQEEQKESLNVLILKRSAVEDESLYARVGMGELTTFTGVELREKELFIA